MTATLVGVSAAQLFDEEPITRLFGMGAYALSIGLIIRFYWKEVDVLYEKKDRAKRKIISVLSGLSVLIFAPLMIGLMAWQFFLLYKRECQQAQGNEIRERNQKDIMHYYITSIVVLTIGTSLVIYSIL